MADYHIYLHGVGKESGNQTTPFSSRENSSSVGESFKTTAEEAYVAKQTTGIKSGSAASTGASALSKVGAWASIIYAIIKIADHVITTGAEHIEDYTGNYKFNSDYNSFKAQLSMIFQPYNAVKGIIHKNFQWQKTNKEITQQNKLVGQSILDRKIGV